MTTLVIDRVLPDAEGGTVLVLAADERGYAGILFDLDGDVVMTYRPYESGDSVVWVVDQEDIDQDFDRGVRRLQELLGDA